MNLKQGTLKDTYNPGQRLFVKYGPSRSEVKSTPVRVVKDYGRFVLVRMLGHSECFFKEDLMDGIK